MQRLLLENYYHRNGEHCETTALANIFRYNGFELTEPMLFGLGHGLRFIYYHPRYMATPLVAGRGNALITPLCKRLGIKAKKHETSNPKKALEGIKRVLATGQPVFIHTDIAMLHYTFVPEDEHFGQHGVAVYGVDEAKGTVWVSDTKYGAFEIALEELARARDSKFKPFPPKNRWYEFTFPERLPELQALIPGAVKTVCNKMLRPPIKYFGVKGYSTWAEDLEHWPRKFNSKILLKALVNMYLYIEYAGNGGSAFRNFYAQFLHEAQELTGDELYGTAAGKIERSAGVFHELACAFLPDELGTLTRIRALLDGMYRIIDTKEPEAREAPINNINRELESLINEAEKDAEKGFPGQVPILQAKIQKLQAIETETFTMLRSM